MVMVLYMLLGSDFPDVSGRVFPMYYVGFSRLFILRYGFTHNVIFAVSMYLPRSSTVILPSSMT